MRKVLMRFYVQCTIEKVVAFSGFLIFSITIKGRTVVG